jgi:hypothetical protein
VCYCSSLIINPKCYASGQIPETKTKTKSKAKNKNIREGKTICILRSLYPSFSQEENPEFHRGRSVRAEDAEHLAKELGTFVEDDFCNLPRYHIYLRLMINGIAGNAFSATTMPPESLRETEKNAPTIIRVSRQRYAVKLPAYKAGLLKIIQADSVSFLPSCDIQYTSL